VSLNVGLIGAGAIAEWHGRAASAARARLVGIVSSNSERSREAARRLGVERPFTSLTELLADDDIQLVHIATPNGLHVEQALAAIEAGKHVICEKPLATTVEDAIRLVTAAKDAGVTATVPFVYRFHVMAREARARVQAGEVGTLFSIRGSYLQDWLLEPTDDNWRVDASIGGASRAFADIGSHLVDLIEFVTGDRITRLVASKRTFFADRERHTAVATEDAVAVTVETANGAIGTLLVSQVAPGHTNGLQLEIAGSLESIRYDQECPETLWLGSRGHGELLPWDSTALHADAARLSILSTPNPQGYQDAFNAFVADSYAAVAGDDPDGLPRFEDGLRAARITEAVLRSADRREWVEIEKETA
jgi:predicted dehydrogenase